MSSQSRGKLHYVLAVIVLGCSAGLMQKAKNDGWLRVIKEQLPIRKPLTDCDRSFVSPYRVVVSQRMSLEVEEELGTTEYLSWILEPPTKSKAWRGQLALTVTYYTGKQDQVPHVPEECFYQGGASSGGDDTIEMQMSRLGKSISVRRLSFYSQRQLGVETIVYYLICVNNEFYTKRNRARLHMGDPRESHLFYSKIEVSFEGVVDKKRSEVDEAAEELLDKTLTELVRSHWPLKGWERGGPPMASPGQEEG